MKAEKTCLMAFLIIKVWNSVHVKKLFGDDAFFAGLSDYLKTNEYGTGEAHQLRLSWKKFQGKI